MVSCARNSCAAALFKTYRRLLVHFGWAGREAVTFAQFFLRQLLHSHNDPATRPLAARPRLDEIVNLPPASKVEVPDAEVCPLGNPQRVR